MYNSKNKFPGRADCSRFSADAGSGHTNNTNSVPSVSEKTCCCTAIESIRSLLRTRWWSHEVLCTNVTAQIATLFKVPIAGISLVKTEIAYGARFQNGKMSEGVRFSISTHSASLICRKYTPSIHYGKLNEQFPFLFGENNDDLKSLICMPLISNCGVILGIIYTADTEKRHFDRSDMSIMDILGWHVSLALERITSNKKELSSSNNPTLLPVFFSGLAHEVRNPLNAINALSSALLNDLGESSEYNHLIKLILQQTERISSLIQQLMMLGEPAVMISSSFDLIRDICRDVVNRWPEINGGTQLNVRFIESRTVSGTFKANSELLEFAVKELLRNALQHSKEGSEIIVDTGEIDEHFYIKIIDNGEGIPDEIRDRVFEPFFTTLKKRNGLGLSLVKRIADVHHGKVALYNNKYFRGATAEILFPVTIEVL